MKRPRALIATYRIQLTPTFGFDAASEVVSYLASLGVSHIYLSPVFEACPGSTHGYDQTDPTRIRAELGGEEAYERLVDAAHAAGLGIIIDIVPNHMAAHHANPWWSGLLRCGPGSEFDRFFDVDWAGGGGRIVLPVLGQSLSEAIAAGEITTEWAAAAGPRVRYFDRIFPLREDLPAPDGSPAPADLADLLKRQHFELAFWRDGLQRINYRRFFDIADLAGLRVEDADVFRATHERLFDLVARGRADGVRVDHIDGLRDPLQYLRRLRAGLDAAAPQGRHIPVWVEKILANDEALPGHWPVDGTTGYEFLCATGSLMSSQDGVPAIRRCATLRGAAVVDFDSLALDCKREIAETSLAPELRRLTQLAAACLESSGHAVDENELRRILADLSAGLRPYRTYADDAGISPDDRDRIRAAARMVRDRTDGALRRVLDALTLAGEFERGEPRQLAVNLVRAWQQFTGPLAAKGVEDTALYRDAACPGLCEVGSEPVAADAAEALRALATNRRLWPSALSATDTHDAKRSEDVRARLAALTRHSDQWVCVLDRVVTTLRDLLSRDGGTVPTPQVLSLIVHSVCAMWPDRGEPDAALRDRLKASIIKSAREAKQGTSWTDPQPKYEQACLNAVDIALSSNDCGAARQELVELAMATRPLAGRLSVGLILLKALFPGAPDWYQGTEFRAISLVDPDNRRTVDFASRRDHLTALRKRWEADPVSTSSEALKSPDSDLAKLFATWRVLAVRRRLLADDGELSLESISVSATRWRWVVAANGRRCIATLRLQAPATSPDARSSPNPVGRDQLSARPVGDSALWASVVVEGKNEIW